MQPRDIVFYTGAVPKTAKPVIPDFPCYVTTTATASPTACINGRHLRPLGEKLPNCHLLKIVTSDPKTKLVICDALTMYNARQKAMGRGIYAPGLFPGSVEAPDSTAKAMVINLLPGSYTILMGLLGGSSEVFIEHDLYPEDYEVEGYNLPGETMELLRKLIRIKGGGVHTEILGKEYVYKEGEIVEVDGEKVGVCWEDGDTTTGAGVKKIVKFCETCHQKLPDENRHRRGEKLFRQKVVEMCDSTELVIRVIRLA